MQNIRQESSGLGGKILWMMGGILLLTAVGLAVYGGTIKPKQQMVEKVLSDENFAH